VQVALTEVDPDPKLQHQQLQVIERLTRRLGHLVDDLLFLARQDSNTVEPAMSMVVLPDLLQEIVEEQQIRATEKVVTLSIETVGIRCQMSGVREDISNSSLEAGSWNLPPDAYTTWGDRNQLARLFTNLISNALQFTPAGGSVRLEFQRIERQDSIDPLFIGKLSYRLKPPYLQIKVIDTGIGIPIDAIDRIFDRFYRVDTARVHSRNQGAGSGLGLAIAQAIVQAHHGHILVESQLGHGSTFTVILPVFVHPVSI
jgi:OmpR-family two-component system manganese-sensing sensor histidine kinase